MRILLVALVVGSDTPTTAVVMDTNRQLKAYIEHKCAAEVSKSEPQCAYMAHVLSPLAVSTGRRSAREMCRQTCRGPTLPRNLCQLVSRSMGLYWAGTAA